MFKFVWDERKNQTNYRKHGFSFTNAWEIFTRPMMNNLPINKPLESNWARIDALTDAEIDTSDIPPLTAEFFARAKVRPPDHFVTVTMQIDAEVIEWFKAQGEDYQALINAALRIYAEAHKVARTFAYQPAYRQSI